MPGYPLDGSVGKDDVVVTFEAGQSGGCIADHEVKVGIKVDACAFGNLNHVFGTIDADDAGMGKLLRKDVGAITRAAADVEDFSRLFAELDAGSKVDSGLGALIGKFEVLGRIPVSHTNLQGVVVCLFMI